MKTDNLYASYRGTHKFNYRAVLIDRTTGSDVWFCDHEHKYRGHDDLYGTGATRCALKKLEREAAQ